MEIRWKLFADLAELADGRTVTVDVDDDATVGDALAALFEGRDALRDRVLDDDGEVRGDVNVLRNGRNVVTQESGMGTEIEASDELAVFPPVSGG
jgi:molybdopterin synthase sulfur carrier subunit